MYQGERRSSRHQRREEQLAPAIAGWPPEQALTELTEWQADTPADRSRLQEILVTAARTLQ
jgi:hypothetical protein